MILRRNVDCKQGNEIFLLIPTKNACNVVDYLLYCHQ